MHDFSRKIYFYCWEKLQKNMYFHPKMAWPPAAYDVISQNHSNCLSLNSSQNVCKEWMNSYWKRQVLMFYPLGKNSKKPSSGAGGCHPPPSPQLPHLVRCTSESKYNDYKFYTIWEISAIWLAQSSGISA